MHHWCKSGAHVVAEEHHLSHDTVSKAPSLRKLAIGILLFLSCCVRPTVTAAGESTFSELVPIVDLNRSIRLVFSKDLVNEFIVGGGVDLLMENVSECRIWFDQRDGIRLFMYLPAQESWTEVRDKSIILTYFPEVLGTRAMGNFQTVVTVQPDLPPLGEPILVRVLVIGERYTGGKMTGEKVGAYKDVLLFPR
jgi:hypothetical protein